MGDKAIIFPTPGKGDSVLCCDLNGVSGEWPVILGWASVGVDGVSGDGGCSLVVAVSSGCIVFAPPMKP